MICMECGKVAEWVRHTQFAGSHHYCKKHAKEEEDFKQSDSYTVWEQL